MIVYKISSLLSKIQDKNPKADLAKVRQAYEFAKRAHKGQRRLSGEDYIQHPLFVAYSLAELGLDTNTICAALLHDVCEDTDISLDEIRKDFGPKIAELVSSVTKLRGLRYYSRQGQLENLRKMFLAIAADIRVVLIRLFDRLHNLKTLAPLNPAKRKRIARQSIEIYAPLADRLGMGHLKGQLEDLAFPHYLPGEFRWVRKLVKEAKPERERYIRKIIKYLKPKLNQAGIKVVGIDGRAKNLYSIYRKLLRYDRDISKIYDLLAVRIIVSTTEDCYKTLGVIHDEFRPLLDRIKDYIAVPKPNGYRALHTTVFALEGKLIEVQIKTLQMHEEAEWGVAAHFIYSEKRDDFKVPSEKIHWLKQLSQWQKDLSSLEEFAEVLASDILGHRIYVFTPAGDIKELPEGASPVDFAYEIHTELGHRCIGAKVNNKIVPLDTPLKSGDTVEVLTSKIPKGPSRDWLNFVKTQGARSKIRAWFRRANWEDNLKSGREHLEQELKRLARKTLHEISKERIKETSSSLGYKDFDSLLVAIGEGRLLSTAVVKKLVSPRELLPRVKKPPLPKIKSEVLVSGQRGLPLRLASCCQPQIGQPIIGYITQRKIAIHNKGCSTLKSKSKEKIIPASWGKEEALYRVPIKIGAKDRIGLLSDITSIASSLKINLRDLNSKIHPDNTLTIWVILEVKSFQQVVSFFQKIEKIQDIISIERDTKSK